ncbi:hypothetical protein H0O00_04980 [Candidatus Micrarchaeota archaeon]|nr:hypothetical protein [Candidatus Micrarchaeota archaeon]
MRAQVSLEYLVLSAVALGLLSISVMALSEIKSSAASNAELLRFRSSAVSLANAMNEVCALGDGNGREVSLSTALSVTSEDVGSGDFGDGSEFGAGSGDGFVARFVGVGGNASIVRKSLCGIGAADELEGLVYVENEDGMITVRGR